MPEFGIYLEKIGRLYSPIYLGFRALSPSLESFIFFKLSTNPNEFLVRAASKLGEDTAKAWEILVTDSVSDRIQEMPDIQLEKTDTIPPGAKAAFKVIYTL